MIAFKEVREVEPGAEIIVKAPGSFKAGYYLVTIETPFRPRTTGKSSQNTRYRGGCRAIAEQLDFKPEEVSDAMKRMAVSEGYPTRLSLDGQEIPVSEAKISVEQETLLIAVMQRFADLNNLWLYEVDDKGVFKSIGGRTRGDMEAWQS
jgi:hypothetical protein